MFKSAASLIADNVSPDSDLKIVNQLARLYQDNACDSIIAGAGPASDEDIFVRLIHQRKGALKFRIELYFDHFGFSCHCVSRYLMCPTVNTFYVRLQ